VVGERARINNATAREGEPRLPLEPGNVAHDALPQRMPVAAERSINKSRCIAGRYGTIGQAAVARLDLDHRLEPVEAARTGADDVNLDAAAAPSLHQRGGDGIGTDRDGARITRDIYPQLHFCASAISASSRSASSRPTTLPSRMAAGAVAHRPRQ